MKHLIISATVNDKLTSKHSVCRREVEQCFENLDGILLLDTREVHLTDPRTQWFLARTNKNRLLKVVFIQRGSTVHLRTCYDPNDNEISIYTEKNGRMP